MVAKTMVTTTSTKYISNITRVVLQVILKHYNFFNSQIGKNSYILRVRMIIYLFNNLPLNVINAKTAISRL
jgi:hypothetical protein